jgi:GTP-binding protein HflX
MVFNKIDLYREKNYDAFVDNEAKMEIEEGLQGSLEHQFGHKSVLVSAVTKENIDELRNQITEMVRDEYHTRYPYLAKQW